ncbi:MAG TPA: maleylacetoacetate isomerase [Parvularcula sp.]|nr:maleylacetoacetate isomerase [Parvularcula sp.]HBS31580.1 maleylacetoacetate isomerase [Parvularcula sp.]HBS34890.1 maleylacetoacetate isomerase [Parvularcula sp.]
MKLFGYWRSSATYRVRIAMELKGLEFSYEPVNLLKGEQRSPAFLNRNPQGLVPALETEEGFLLTQSIAIIEYLEERYPEVALLPADAAARAHARAIAATIACEAQPFMNLRMQKYLKEELDFDDAAMKAWLGRWPGGAMESVEALVERYGAGFCVGDKPTTADCFLIPQMYGALRFGVDLSRTPRLKSIHERCAALDPFKRAHPENQPDAVRT